MSWTITLEVTDCAAMGTKLSGVKVKLSLVELGQTDAQGKFTATLDDFDTLPIFKFSKQDYNDKNAVFDKDVHAGTTQTVCLDNPNTIPDGHDPNIPGQSGGQEFDGGGCFIITATTGSATSTEVTELRALRDRVRARSPLAGRLIDSIYADYARFSPAIASGLHGNAFARNLVLGLVVKPLFAWYRLAGVLGLEPENSEAQSAWRAALVEAGAVHRQLAPMLSLLAAARTDAERAGPVPPQLRQLAAQLEELPHATWALLDPLTRICKIADEGSDPAAEIADWLACAPIEAARGPVSRADLRRERSTIAGFFSFAPGRREAVLTRLDAIASVPPEIVA